VRASNSCKERSLDDETLAALVAAGHIPTGPGESPDLSFPREGYSE
jgi:hypothetical protein